MKNEEKHFLPSVVHLNAHSTGPQPPDIFVKCQKLSCYEAPLDPPFIQQVTNNKYCMLRVDFRRACLFTSRVSGRGYKNGAVCVCVCLCVCVSVCVSVS